MIHQALLYSFSSKYAMLAIQISSTLILARILTPEHIGLFTVAAAITGIAQMFRDFGISEYIIKEKETTNEMLSAAFSASVLIAYPLALLFVFSSYYIGVFYENLEVGILISILCLNLFLSPFGSIPMATMKKEMNFKPVSIANILNTVVNSGGSIALAWFDFGAYSLAISSVLGTLTTVAVINFYKDKNIKLKLTTKGLKKTLTFGKNIGGGKIITYFADSALELLIAKATSMSELGLYSRAKSTLGLFDKAVISAVRPIVMPYFSKTNNHNASYLETSYYKATVTVAYLALPFSIAVGAFGDTIIYILYGSQWISASEYIIYLAIALAISSLNLFYENILVSTDNQKLFLRFNLILSIAKILIACSIFFAPLTKVLELIIYMNLGRLFFVCFSLKHLLDFKLKSQISAFKGPIISSLLLIIVAFLYKQIQENIIEWMMLPVFGLSVVIWAFSIIVFDRELIKFVLKTN